MPIVAQQMFTIDVKENGLIEILQDEINQCGCVSLAAESERLQTPIDRLLAAMRHIDSVACTDSGVCCSTDVTGFAEKLHKLTGGG